MNNVNVRKRLFGSVILSMMAVVFFATASLAADTPVMSSDELITKAYKDDVIDLEAYIVQKLRSIFAPDTLDPSFQSDVQNKPTREVTTLLDEARKHYDSFSDESKAFLDILFKRPDDPTNVDVDFGKFFLPAPVSTFEPAAANFPKIGGKFKFHYVTHDTADGGGHKHKTTLEFVKKMASAFEKVYKTEVSDTLKYAAPPNDPGGAGYGGDTKFDVYVMNIGGGGVYGWVQAEGASSGNSWYSYMVMDNDFTEFVTASITAEEAMQVTAAHEYHHAVQNGINVDADSWYKEATSTWMEDQVYDAIDDNLQYLNGRGASDFFFNPEKSLDDTTGNLEYAHWIWNEFMETKWDQDTIKKVWDNLDPAGKNNAVDAIVAVLATKDVPAGETALGDTLKESFTGFAAKNYSQKGFYKDAAKYDEVYIDNSHTLDFSTATSHKVDWQLKTVDHLASKYYKIKPGSTLKKPTMLSIEVDGADNKDVNAIAIVKKKDGSFVEHPFTLDAVTKKGEVGIPGFSPEKIIEVVLALVNYSKADDSLEIKYKASLMKPFTFVIDDTGSMGGEIAAAKAAANKVLDDNKAAGLKRFYTLISFKDGPGTIDGQSSDEDTMKSFVNSLFASGGAGCPESSLLSIRQATELAEGGDIMMMTDASSNSFGIDDTFATWGEVVLTVSKLLETNSRLHTIIYDDCGSFDMETDKDEFLQCPGCYKNKEMDSIAIGDNPSGVEGYNMLSSESGGLFFKATTAETETLTEIILRSSTADSTISIFDGTGAATYNIPIDGSISQFQVIMNADEGSSVNMTVKSPAGTEVDGATDGVTVSTSAGSTHFLIDSPAVITGNWKATVSGTGTYRISVEGATTNPMTYTGDTSVGVGGTLNMEASIRQPVSGVVFGIIKPDGSDPVSVPVTTTDGLNYTGSVVMNTVGKFLFGVIGDGNFLRINPTKITVGNVEIVAPEDKNVTPGTSFIHTFQLRNKGTAEDTYTLTASSSKGWADVAGKSVPVTVAAGETVDLDIPVNVPSDATTGQVDRLSIQAVSQTDPSINSTDETETRVTTSPRPGITVSDSEKVGVVTTSTGILIGKVSLSAGTGLGVNADWWVAANTPLGWFYYNLASGWTFVGDPSGLIVTYQGPLFDLIPAVEILNFSVSGLPSGPYTFYFGVDTNMNGIIDFDELFFDSAEIEVP